MLVITRIKQRDNQVTNLVVGHAGLLARGTLSQQQAVGIIPGQIIIPSILNWKTESLFHVGPEIMNSIDFMSILTRK